MIQYKYDVNGLRTSKTINGSVTEYYMYNKMITHMKSGSNQLHFFYDAQRRPIFVKYNNDYYAYLYNMQGDVVAILDSTNAFVVTYTYDAWGGLLGMDGSMATTLGILNPYRFRGYIYDDETGLYYLGSRYYNPEWCRFINIDSISGVTGALLTHNLWAYCGNNPVSYKDTNGNFLGTIIGAVVGGIVGGVSAALTGDDVWAGIGSGAISGAVTGFAADFSVATCGAGAPIAVGIVASATFGAIGTAGGYYLNETWNGREVSTQDIVEQALVGGVWNTMSFGLGCALSPLSTAAKASKYGWGRAIWRNLTNKPANFGRYVAATAGFSAYFSVTGVAVGLHEAPVYIRPEAAAFVREHNLIEGVHYLVDKETGLLLEILPE